MRADLGWVPQFAKLGVLVPLSDAMADFKKLADKTYPGILATNLYKGNYYGLPLDTNTRVLITNQAALDAAGITAPPASFDELKAAAGKLKAADISVFADGGLEAWNIMPWIWSAGGDSHQRRADQGHRLPQQRRERGDRADAGRPVQGGRDPEPDHRQHRVPPAPPTACRRRTYATIFDGPWMAGIWKGQYPDFKPIYSPIPAGPGGSVSVVGGEDIVVTASSQTRTRRSNSCASRSPRSSSWRWSRPAR